jgi:hypothetical protein
MRQFSPGLVIAVLAGTVLLCFAALGIILLSDSENNQSSTSSTTTPAHVFTTGDPGVMTRASETVRSHVDAIIQSDDSTSELNTRTTAHCEAINDHRANCVALTNISMPGCSDGVFQNNLTGYVREEDGQFVFRQTGMEQDPPVCG